MRDLARGWSPPGLRTATGSPCWPRPATSGRWSTTRSGTPAASPSRSTRRRRPSRSPGSSSDSGARVRRGRARRARGGACRPADDQLLEHVWTMEPRRGRADLATLVAPGRGDDRRGPRRPPRGGGRGRRGHDRLHLRHHRPSQGLRAHARQLPGRARGDHRGARASSSRPTTPPRCCSCRSPHVFARIVQVGAVKQAGPARPHRGHPAPRRRPGGVPPHVRPGRPPHVREDLQHREPAGRGRTAAAGSSTGPPTSPSPTAGRWTTAGPARCSAPSTRSSTGSSTSACARRWAAVPLRHLRRRAARRAARPLLPRHRHPGPRGLRPHRDDRRRSP